MSRILLQYLLPLVLPSLVFFLWAWLARRRVAGGIAAQLQQGPWFWLIVAGFVLMAGGLIYTALNQGGEAGSRLIPPRYEGGRVVPAEIR